MFILVLGLLLGSLVHLAKRLAPGPRSALTERLGEVPAKIAVAAGIGLGVLLMIVGYRAAPYVPVYTPPAWGVHLNNLMMLAAVALLGMGTSKGRARARLRHPMLTGVLVWGVAHLVVNGDVASLILFGGLAVWSVVEMLTINAAEGPWQRPEPGPVSGDIRLVVITLVAYAVIAAIHAWLGYWPFPG